MWAEGSLGDFQGGRVRMRGTVLIPTNFVLSSSLLSTSFQGLASHLPQHGHSDSPLLHSVPFHSDDNLSTDVLQATEVQSIPVIFYSFFLLSPSVALSTLLLLPRTSLTYLPAWAHSSSFLGLKCHLFQASFLILQHLPSGRDGPPLL